MIILIVILILIIENKYSLRKGTIKRKPVCKNNNNSNHLIFNNSSRVKVINNNNHNNNKNKYRFFIKMIKTRKLIFRLTIPILRRKRSIFQ